MYVAVSVPSLHALTVQGSGNISVSGIHRPTFSVRLPGSGTIHAARTTARLDLAMGGSGTVLVSGLMARDAAASIDGRASTRASPAAGGGGANRGLAGNIGWAPTLRAAA